jgi:AraC family transcriptional regulator
MRRYAPFVHNAPMTQRSSYAARINRVIDHIDAHLAEPLDLHALADVAHFSAWHFHRLFQAFAGETLGERVRRRRLEVAATRLLKAPPVTALSIALDVGFGSAEVFTYAFKAHFGVTPSAWRRGGWRDWAQRHRNDLSKIHQAQRNAHQAVEAVFRDDAKAWRPSHAPPGAQMKVELKNFPETRVAYMRHVGPYGDPGIASLWQRFDAWCRQGGRSRPGRAIHGVTHDSPDITAPAKCRYDACIDVDADFKASGDVGVQTLPGGLYACTPFSGTPDTIHAAWMRLCAEWLPDSHYQADDRPAIEAYGDAVEVDPKTGAFKCQLCLPVRAL